MSDIFRQASRLKLRFNGNLSVDDLWDLPLTSKTKTNLNDIARGISRQIKANADDEDFVNGGSNSTNTLDNLRMKIVLDVISTLKAENEAKVLQQANRQRNQRILEIIQNKEDQSLQNMSLEELKAMVTT